MNKKELQLAAHFLNEASSQYANNGCNDVDESVWSRWTKEERQEFVKGFHEYNGDPEEYDPEYLHLPDFAIMGYLAHKLTTLPQTDK